MHKVADFTNRRAFRINLTCSGKLQAFRIPVLEFSAKFLDFENGDPKR